MLEEGHTRQSPIQKSSTVIVLSHKYLSRMNYEKVNRKINRLLKYNQTASVKHGRD